MKKDAKYYCEEGVKRYKKGSKSALKSFQKALELALNDPSTPNELLNDIYTDLFCYYDKLSPDYSKALIYFDKIIDTNIDDEEIAKAKEFRAELKANPDKFDEQTLLKRANQIRIMNEPDSGNLLLYIKSLILFDNPKCDEIFYIVAQNNESNSTSAAERNIKQAIAINPNRQEYYDLYFSIMLRILADEYGEKTFSKTVKKYDKTIKDTINKSIKIKPTAQAYLNYYYYYNLLRDFKSALKVLDKAIELDPENAFMYEYRAQLKRENNDTDGAIKDFESALAIYPYEKDDYTEIANLYYKKFGKEKVYEYLEEKISQFSSEKELYLYLLINKANFEKEYGDYDLCLSDCDRVTNLSQFTPNEKSNIYQVKATCLRQKGDFENALKSIDCAIELDPNCAQKYMDKGQILGDQKKYEEAISCYKKAEEISLKEDGYIPEYLCTHIGYFYGCLDKYLEAMKYYNKAIKKGLDSWYPYRNKIVDLIHLGKYKFALKWAERAEKLFKNELDNGFYSNKGLVCYHLKDYKNAVKNFKKYPQWGSGQILTAYIDFLQGNSKSALKKLEKFKPTTPAEIDYKLRFMAVIYYKNQKYDKALECLILTKDKNCFYYYIKSCIFNKLGDNVNAEENLNFAKSTLEENETIEYMIKIIEDDCQVNFD